MINMSPSGNASMSAIMILTKDVAIIPTRTPRLAIANIADIVFPT